MTREDGRQFVHLGTTAFAVTLLWLPLWAGYAACGAAIAFWWIVVPLMKRDVGFTRPGEPFVNGLRTYPVAVLLLLFFFRHPAAHPLATPVAAWGVLGVGDSFSNLVGRPWGTHGFVGRKDRSMLGTFAFVVTAWPAAWALATLVGGMPSADAWKPALVAAVAGAVAELIPLPFRLDDNLPVALAAGAAFLATS
jgi:dolichol kinase